MRGIISEFNMEGCGVQKVQAWVPDPGGGAFNALCDLDDLDDFCVLHCYHI